MAKHDFENNHKPLHKCILCNTILPQDLLMVHLYFDCDDDEASKHFRSLELSREYCQEVHAKDDFIKTLPKKFL